MSVTATHPVKSSGLDAATAVLKHATRKKNPKVAELIFVVPPSIYDDFKEQKFVPKGVTLKRPVRQLVMKVEVRVRAPPAGHLRMPGRHVKLF